MIDPWHEHRATDASTYRILVIQQKYSGVWGLPKGHLELGEEVKDAAWREMQEETGVHLSHLVEGVDYLPVPIHAPKAAHHHPNHLVLKKIHFFVYVLLRGGCTLVHSRHDTKEVAAITWMNVHRWEIDAHPSRFESHLLENGHVTVVPTVHHTPASKSANGRPKHPPRFNRTLADTSVLALREACASACRCVGAHFGGVEPSLGPTVEAGGSSACPNLF